MSRTLRVASAQLGAIDIDTPLADVLARMNILLDEAHKDGCTLVNYPELCFSTFFARHLIPFGPELDRWFCKGDILTNPEYSPFFERAKGYGISVCVGYAELTEDGEHFNTAIFVDGDGNLINKYRKMHLPGDKEPRENVPVQHLEKRYFKDGDLGFKAFRWPGTKVKEGPILGQLICNDRRWAESWRVLGLQGAELVLIGYNTPSTSSNGIDGVLVDASKSEEMAMFHNELCCQYNSYANCTFSICTARCGLDDGKWDMIGGSVIVNPYGEIIARSTTKGDELTWADIDLDLCIGTRKRIFDFSRHRRPDQYTLISTQKEVIPPPALL
ncbi:hypothetical protein KL925_004289 [Ogataea polymorpha]|nr:hypothetical protein KL925_004289 [Ogataea polymorpha]